MKTTTCKFVWLANDNVLRSCLEIAKDNGYKSFTVSLDSPAKNLSSYAWKDAQSRYGVREPELVPEVDIQPKLLLDNEKTAFETHCPGLCFQLVLRK